LWGRHALLKTVRTIGLPPQRLLERRRLSLEAERDRLSRLTLATLPEPLDAFTLPNGEPALVCALFGEARGNFLLREKIQRWGFIQSAQGERYRQLDKIAEYMLDVTRFTEELWRAGFVHANLCPDHLYYLRDGV